MNFINTTIINMLNSYKNANEAYKDLLHYAIQDLGVDFDNTKALFNCGFYIQNPLDNHITDKQRKWSLEIC